MKDSDILKAQDVINRRLFLQKCGIGFGSAALLALMGDNGFAAVDPSHAGPAPLGMAGLPHFAPKAKRVIYLFQSGAPSQMDLFDYKPTMNQSRGLDLPDSVRMGQRLTGMTSGQKNFPVAPSAFKFDQYGPDGMWLSELLPYTSQIAGELCFIRSMYTEAINHDPACTFFQTGSQIAGRPSIGSWLSYGLGSENRDLPAYIVLTSIGTGRPEDQPVYDRLWGSGFLPNQHAGVKFRNAGDRVPYIADPAGVDRKDRRAMLDDVAALNQAHAGCVHDPEIDARISQYEMAFRMQASVPELLDISGEPQHILDMYGPEVKKPGTYASNCLLARRLAERGVRFTQLFHRGWDHHDNTPKRLKGQCYDTDQASAALVMDLKQRGLLEDTLVVWGGEFGRTPMNEGRNGSKFMGRDHHPKAFTVLLAGGGIRGGMSYGETDELGYNVVKDHVHVHDLQATILHCLGIDHTKLTYKFQGRDYRLTDVHGEVCHGILA